MGWTTDLTTGLAAHLASNGIGTWRPDGPPYGPDEVGITIADLPPQPDRLICLTPYPVDENVATADVRMGLQVRCRSGRDPRGSNDLDDQVFDLIHGAEHLALTTGVHVVQIFRQSSTPMGRDSNDRWEHASTYLLDAMRPTVTRPY